MRNTDPFSDLLRSLEENLQRDGDWVPPGNSEPQPQRHTIDPRRWLWLVLPVLVIILFARSIGFLTDVAWYRSVGYEAVYWTRLWASAGLFAGAALVFFLFFAFNVWLARRLEPLGLVDTPLEELLQAFGLKVMPAVLLAGALVALLMGMNATGWWETILLYWNQLPFGVIDPIFNRDISFFVFTLPVWETVRGWLMLTIVLAAIGVVLVSGVNWRGWRIRPPLLVHLALLGALLLVLVAWGYRVNAFGIVYSQRGAVFGAGYTDVHAQLPAYNLLALLSLAAAVLLVVIAVLRRGWRMMVGVVVAWVLVALLAGGVYPGLIQRFQVSPNELTLERSYIANNIEYTRLAYGIHNVQEQSYDGSKPLTVSALLAEPETIRNIRLWDYRPLLQTYNQVQTLRQYYEFNDIDIDRYVVDGKRQQVMLGARELVADRLDQDAQTWVNRKLVYTHGYGVAVSPVANVTRDGLPEFLVSDLPSKGVIDIQRPQIYFGERTDSYVIGQTRSPEFDYPQATGNATTQFSATTGIPMTFWNRLVFAIHFAEANLILNQDISADSQLLWRQNIVERVQLVAPFLRFDADPYIVISDDGQLFWIMDGLTVSDRFPYSEPLGAINYIRNPVKVTINAYDGVMTFYVIDDKEPILAAYSRIFPKLFQPIDKMPADLKDNLRFPEDLFVAQAEMIRTYHMTDPTEFYNKEDMWAWPEELFESQLQPVEPYSVLMQLPGNESLDYVQFLPFTPANRENMIAWLAVQHDWEKYGQKVIYEFGKDSLLFGPKQVEARIDQDPTISAQLTLWNQQGSGVIRGNLLVIPIDNSLLYVEPIYLQAANGRIPELKRVIVATAERVVMAENLGLALVAMFGQDVLASSAVTELGATSDAVTDAASTAAATTELPSTLAELIARANELYNSAQTESRNGDWAAYGATMDELQAVLTQLVAISGAPVAEPAPQGTVDQPEPTATPVQP